MKKLKIAATLIIIFFSTLTVYSNTAVVGSMWKQIGSILFPADDITGIDFTGINVVGIGSSDIAFSAHKNGVNQTGVVTSTFTKVTFTTERFDEGGAYDAANSKFIAPFDGRFWFYATVLWTTTSDQDNLIVRFYYNGSFDAARSTQNITSTSATFSTNSAAYGFMDLLKDDEVEIYVRHTSGSDKTISGAIASSRFECIKAIPN